LVGPASVLYSMEEPPSTMPPPLASVVSSSSSVGSPSLRVSHHSMRPSVETDAHWLPVLEEILVRTRTRHDVA
jgi:hypothetical protein